VEEFKAKWTILTKRWSMLVTGRVTEERAKEGELQEAIRRNEAPLPLLELEAIVVRVHIKGKTVTQGEIIPTAKDLITRR
jgi:hypothetical protein